MKIKVCIVVAHYYEDIAINGKSLIIASEYIHSNHPKHITNTVLYSDKIIDQN